MMRTLFLQAPSFDGFDGGAGARYQMRREVRSFWYPTWLAQPAALVEGSKLIDAPPHRPKFEDVASHALGRDLVIENYFGGYLKHPYISFYTGRGCKSRCTFCLWPQTIGGHRYRVRSVAHVIDELIWARNAFPQVKEFFFDDDTLTDNLPRVEALAREIGKLGIVWSCNAKANVPRATLKVLRDNGLRLLLVGYESGNQQILHNIKKGMRVDVARRFAKD